MQKEQGDICPLCGRPLGADVVLDHDHRTGDIRAVVHRWCNAVLGKIENWPERIGQGVNGRAYLKNVVAYLDYHDAHPSGIKHNTHRTDDEKRLLRNKRARLARRKAKETH